jgi:hypothetical protein
LSLSVFVHCETIDETICRARRSANFLHTTSFYSTNASSAVASGALRHPSQNNHQILFFAFSAANYRFTI